MFPFIMIIMIMLLLLPGSDHVHFLTFPIHHDNHNLFFYQVQIMYYAGFRVLPEAPLREDWVQVMIGA